MVHIHLETLVEAPVKITFDLARDIRPKFGAGIDAGQSLPPTSPGANRTPSTGGRIRLTHGDLGLSFAGSERPD
jgi:hypothetical protein